MPTIGTMEITVRSAMPEEAEAIARMHVRSWQAAYRGLFPDAYLDGLDWREWAERRRADIADGDKQVRVAVDGTVVLGFASFGPTRDDDLPAGTPELYGIYLDPDRWARGLGGCLLDALPPGPLTLWVLADNERAIRFYTRHGFVPDGCTKEIDRGGHRAAQVRYRRAC